jgi:hypothetical protein
MLGNHHNTDAVPQEALMPKPDDPNLDFNEPWAYEIRLKGHLGPEWSDWFDGLTITPEDNGETLITGAVTDQAALFGLLKKVRDLGIPLLAINCIKAGQGKPGGE